MKVVSTSKEHLQKTASLLRLFCKVRVGQTIVFMDEISVNRPVGRSLLSGRQDPTKANTSLVGTSNRYEKGLDRKAKYWDMLKKVRSQDKHMYLQKKKLPKYSLPLLMLGAHDWIGYLSVQTLMQSFGQLRTESYSAKVYS